MERYICTVCGFVYDPEEGDFNNGVEEETIFDDLPEDWVCPVCGGDLDDFIAEI